jgi:hypothetical protein
VTVSELAARTAKAVALADTLAAAGATAACLDRLDDADWELARMAAAQRCGRPIGAVSTATRRAVKVILEDRERHPDPFGGLPTAHGPRT